MIYLDQLGFNLIAYGCTTCIGNSGPLKKQINDVIIENKLSVASVLSGNRNFEARVHSYVRQNYLMSPMLVVYAIVGTVDIDLYNNRIGISKENKPVYMKDIWPKNKQIWDLINNYVTSGQYKQRYSQILQGDENWQNFPIIRSDTYNWIEESTYIKKAPFFEDFTLDLKSKMI